MLANKILCGDALQTLRSLPSESVHCIVTSPPYYALRDYGVDGQIGLEETPAAFVAVLVEVFREARRVLRKDGTLWCNMGDSYSSGSVGRVDSFRERSIDGRKVTTKQQEKPRFREVTAGFKPKDLMMIPARLAIALQDDGWYLRSDIIWHKINAMPESVQDRPTNAHEHLFLLSKSERYFYDADAIREPHSMLSGWARQRAKGVDTWEYGQSAGGTGINNRNGVGSTFEHPSGRNKRNVWSIAAQPYGEAHFATMPPKLIEPCILAGTSPQTCEYCGAPWERVTKKGEPIQQHWAPGTQKKAHIAQGKHGTTSVLNTGFTQPSITVGWQPTCTCTNEGTGKAVVLDPFMGAGTTALVAIRLQRDYLGIELNPAYVELIEKRIAEVQPTLWAGGVA